MTSEQQFVIRNKGTMEMVNDTFNNSS